MHHHLDLRRKKIIMLSVMASLFLVALDQTIVSTALGRIVEDFKAFDSLSWIVTAYLLTTTVTVPIAGKLSDLFGRRILLLVGVALFGVSSLLCGTSDTVGALILWRAIQGIGGGIITANAFTIIGDLFAARERGRWQGIFGAVFGMSSVIGPLLGGWLTESQHIGPFVTSWHWIFWINVPIAVAAFALIAAYCPSLRHAKHPKIDYVGALLLSGILALTVLSVDNTEAIFKGVLEATGMSLVTLRCMLGTVIVALIGIFIYQQRKTPEPIMPMRFFRNRNFSLIMGVAMLFGAGFMGAIVYLTQFNQQVFGASPTNSGLMLLPMVGGTMIASIGSGQLISRTGKYKRFMQVGIVLATVMLVALTTLTPESSFAHEAIIMFFLGFGLGLVMPVMNLVVQGEFSQKDLGVATSAIQLFRGLGSTVGIALFGTLLTSGVAAQLGDMSSNAYVQTLHAKSSAVTQQLGKLTDANTLILLNSPGVKTTITTKFEESIKVSNAPQSVITKIKDDFTHKQQEFTRIITHAFAAALHSIFVVSAILMGIAAFLIWFIKERILKKTTSDITPGEL